MGKRVLVTGAGGWIGSALVYELLRQLPELIVLLDSSESQLYGIDAQLCEANSRNESVVPHASVLGSVTDAPLLRELFLRYRPQIVFHAAACKHVPLMEANPFAAIWNNAIGTHTLAQVVKENPVEEFIFVSTDKAADPQSIMGASKRIAEIALLCPQRFDGEVGMQTKIARLVNVFGSPGSVVPKVLEQISAGGSVTVTHPDAKRFFMMLSEAVDLLLALARPNIAPGLYVPRISSSVRILDLAHRLIAEHAPASPNIEILFTGLRPGDKLTETLLAKHETWATSSPNTIGRRVETSSPPAIRNLQEFAAAMQALQTATQQRCLKDMLACMRPLVPEYTPSSAVSADWTEPCATTIAVGAPA